MATSFNDLGLCVFLWFDFICYNKKAVGKYLQTFRMLFTSQMLNN